MKWNGLGRGAMLSVALLATGLGVSSCSRDYTVAYVYATASTTGAQANEVGAINAYAVDYQSGALTQLADSPVSSGGRNPVTLVATPDSKTIFVFNRDDSSIVNFAVGTDGKIYAKNTYNVSGSFPVAAAVDAGGKFLYVLCTFQTGYTTASPGPGNVNIFPITKDSSQVSNLGTPTVVNVGFTPVGVVTSAFNNYVYVLDQQTSTGTLGGQLLAYSEDTGTGALAPIGAGYTAGTVPSAIAIDPTAKFLYVSDKSTNQIYGYTLASGGVPAPMVSSPYSTGLFPVALTIEPRGNFLYAANQSANTLSSYAISPSTGALTATTGTNVQVGTGPTCIAVEPALGLYLFTSNNIDHTVSAEQLDSHTGTLKAVQNTPFQAQNLPTCVISIANATYGHASQAVTP